MLLMSFLIQKVQQHISTFVCMYFNKLPKMTNEQFLLQKNLLVL